MQFLTLSPYSQDTNTIQYELMKRIAAASGCVTLVGDPDQSSELSTNTIQQVG